MNLIVLLISTGLSFLFLLLLFRPLEMAFQARAGQRFFRPNWLLDLCFFLGQYLLWTGLVFGHLALFRDWLGIVVPASLRQVIASQPWWLQVIEIVLLSDFLIYWAHRLQHRVGFLWRFHAVHHSAEHLDWLAAHREHPLDTLYTVGIINLPPSSSAFLWRHWPASSLSGVSGRSTSTPTSACPWARCVCCWARRSCTIGITIASTTPAITPTCRRSWTCCLAPTVARTKNRTGSASRNPHPELTSAS
jgi:hypothetical protein